MGGDQLPELMIVEVNRINLNVTAVWQRRYECYAFLEKLFEGGLLNNPTVVAKMAESA